MNKKQNKVVKFVKSHQKEITLGVTSAAALICGVAYIAKAKKTYASVNAYGVIESLASNDVSVDDWSVGTLTKCWRESGWINAIAKDFTVADAGKLGEELLKIDGVTMDTAMEVVMCVPDIKVD